jgi:hypothetical protein
MGFYEVLVSRGPGCLNRATSKFISARLDLDGVQYGHKDVYWFGHERPYIQWVSLWFVLPCTGVLVVGVTSFFERVSRSQISCEWWCVKRDSGCCCHNFSMFQSPFYMWPLPPLL